MDSLIFFVDSIRCVANASCQCAKANSETPTSWEDVEIAAIIAMAVCFVVFYICKTVLSIIKMNKQEGIKKIVGDILKEKEVQPTE